MPNQTTLRRVIYSTSSTPEPEPPVPGPVSTLQTDNISYYFFNGNVLDSYNINNGTATDITYADQAAVFNGTTSRVKLCDGKIDPANGAMGTVSADFKLTAIGVGENPTIFSYGGDVEVNNPFLQLGVLNLGGLNYVSIGARKPDGGTSVVRGDTSIIIDTDYKVVFGSDGSNYVIYVNGVLQTLTTVAGAAYAGWFDQITSTVNPETVVGVRKVIGLYLNPFTGQISHLSYWSRLLEDYELANLYNLGDGNDYPYTPGGVAAFDISIFTADATYTRWQTFPPVLMDNGKYLHPVIRFGTNPTDLGGITRLYDSSNLSTFNYIGTEIGVSAGTINNWLVGTGKRTNGDLYFIFFQTMTGGLTSRFMYATSTDNGATVSALSVLRENAMEYVNPPINGMFVTDTGRWLFPFDLLTSGDPSTGDYEGMVMYSDDEGANWTTPAGTITSPDGQCLESVYYYDSDDELVRIFRSKLGPYYAANSTDDGETYGAVYDSGLLYNDDQPNGMSVIKLASGNYIASFNIDSRMFNFIAHSVTGKQDEWTYYYLNVEATSGEQVSPFAIKELGDYIYMYYMISSDTISRFSLRVYKLYKPSYPVIST